MHIADIIKEKGAIVISTHTTAPLTEAIAILDQERIGALIVVDESGQVVGMLSERDLIGVLAEYGDRALIVNVGALMSRHVYVCSPEDTLETVLSWMVHYRVRHLPVVENETLKGLISIGDIAKHLIDEAPAQPRVLREVIALSKGDN